MALPPGTIVVASPGFDTTAPKGLFAVDPTSGRRTPLAQGGMLVEPWNVEFLADGRLLVADRSAFGTGGLIAVDPASGQQTKVSSPPQTTQPFGLALPADGQVVVAYRGGHSFVFRVDPATGAHRAIDASFPFDGPFDVALDAAGNVIVTDPEIFRGDPNRLIRIDVGVGASIRADSPGHVYIGVAVEPSGNIVVGNRPLADPAQLLRFPATSGPATVVSQGGKLTDPGGIAVEANGAILVNDAANGVLRIDPATGAQTTVSTGRNLGLPNGLTIRR
jgi:sugar lactone lactonase YvrE